MYPRQGDPAKKRQTDKSSQTADAPNFRNNLFGLIVLLVVQHKPIIEET
jgi:hypothetical protein